MTFGEFQRKSERTINKMLNREQLENHALFGIGSEAGEVLGLYQKKLQGHELKPSSIVEELGDLLWFIAELCTAVGYDMDIVAEQNVKKLAIRYKERFSEIESQRRVDHDGA